MWVTVEEVKELTGQDVPLTTIAQAQGVIESYVGRLEPEVNHPTDKMLLGRATAYQAVYMFEDEEKVFGTVAARQVMQFGNSITYRESDTVSPFVSQLAVIACQRLTWKRMRSVKVGSLFSQRLWEDNWRTT